MPGEVRLGVDVDPVALLVEPLAHHGELLAEASVGVLDGDVDGLNVDAGDLGEGFYGLRERLPVARELDALADERLGSANATAAGRGGVLRGFYAPVAYRSQ